MNDPQHPSTITTETETAIPSSSLSPTATPLFLPTRTVVTHTSNDISVVGATNPFILHATTDCYSPDGTDTDTLSSIPSQHIPSQHPVITIQLNEREEQLLTILRNVMDLYNHHHHHQSITLNSSRMRQDLHIDTVPTSSSVDESSPRLETTNRDDDDDDVVEEEEDVTALLVVRIAGGWIRDKLLGRSNDDVDIATNVVTGVQFAQLLQSYLQEHPQQQQQEQQQPKTVAATRMGIIASNPEQSKHLETACMRICQIDMDITNLRGQEQYQDPNSRIPLLVQMWYTHGRCVPTGFYHQLIVL
jgi:Poly A polymerase head domain